MSISDTVGPADSDAPWDTPDPLTCVRQLQSLVGLGYSVGHESTGDLQTLIQSAMSGIRKEVEMHMDFMGTEHVEHKTDHHLQRKMVRFWKCSAVTLHENQTFYVGDTEPDSDHVYYQWNKMKNLPGWYIKKIWHSYDGWLWWPRRKSSICWFSNLHANWTKEFWWKRLLAPRVAWIPKGKHWLQI